MFVSHVQTLSTMIDAVGWGCIWHGKHIRSYQTIVLCWMLWVDCQRWREQYRILWTDTIFGWVGALCEFIVGKDLPITMMGLCDSLLLENRMVERLIHVHWERISSNSACFGLVSLRKEMGRRNDLSGLLLTWKLRFLHRVYCLSGTVSVRWLRSWVFERWV